MLNDYLKDQITKGRKMPYDTFSIEQWFNKNYPE